MAYTKIMAIKSQTHLVNAINYSVENKVNFENENEEHKTYTTFLNTSSFNTAKEWEDIRIGFGKNNGKLAFQIIQNFGGEIDAAMVHEIGVKFAKELLGNRQCIISTHTNTDHRHNHIIFNSPNLENGAKYADGLKSYYSQVRKISDRLCDEYGLKVLEDTRDGSLRFYKDENGKTRYFEPTKRKEGQRNYNSQYTQSENWDKDERRRKNRVHRIIDDMEIVIPLSKDYDDFLQRMKNIGYGIKAKTQGGEWRKHITFFEPSKPSGSRGVRDTSPLMKGYSRKEISARIAELGLSRQGDNHSHSENDMSGMEFTDYESISEIRSDIRKNNTPRSQLDSYLASEIAELNRSLNSKLYSAYKGESNIQPTSYSDKEQLKAIEQINSKVRALNYMERYGIYTFNNLQAQMESCLAKRNSAAFELNTARKKLSVMNGYVVAIEKSKKLKSHIENHVRLYGKSYVEAENSSEINVYRELIAKLDKANLNSDEEQQKYLFAVKSYREKYRDLVGQLQVISNELYRYDDIYRGLKSGGEFKDELTKYEQVRFDEGNCVDDSDRQRTKKEERGK